MVAARACGGGLKIPTLKSGELAPTTLTLLTPVKFWIVMVWLGENEPTATLRKLMAGSVTCMDDALCRLTRKFAGAEVRMGWKGGVGGVSA